MREKGERAVGVSTRRKQILTHHAAWFQIVPLTLVSQTGSNDSSKALSEEWTILQCNGLGSDRSRERALAKGVGLTDVSAAEWDPLLGA